MEKVELPEIEGITVPRYVRQLAAGKPNQSVENIPEIHPTQAKFNLNNIQTELVSHSVYISLDLVQY